MNIEDIIAALNPDIIEKFKRAIEIGKWADGNLLSQEQKNICMQAIIAYESENLAKNERTGYVPPKTQPCDKSPLDSSEKKNTKGKHLDEKPLKWKN